MTFCVASAPAARSVRAIAAARALGGVPGDGDLTVWVAGVEGGVEFVDVAWLEPVGAAAQQAPRGA
jgi:hypothetical protein